VSGVRVDVVRSAARTPRFPVVEMFGPTIQGEGWVAGLPTYFIRFGGCDWRCRWCDSMHAVLPAEVRKAPKLTVDEIVAWLPERPAAEWVTFSGGNPALHSLGPLLVALYDRGLKVAVETQGSRWRPWLGDVDHLTISPKAPSSGEAQQRQAAQVAAFMRELREVRHEVDGRASLKVVVFDETDLRWALDVATEYPWLEFFISVGTDSQGKEPLEATAERYRQVCELVANDGVPAARRARVLPQLHVIAWGHRLGV